MPAATNGRAKMSAKDAKIEVDVDDESLWHALIRSKTLKDDADSRLEDLEATQFDRGHN